LRTRKDIIQKQKIELPDSSLGQKLKALRLNKNLTQKEFSELTGIARSTLCDYEAGRKNFGRKVALKLAGVLGVGVGYLRRK